MQITFDSISFTYPIATRTAPQSVLNNITADVQTGKLIGICGATGSGKSTLIRLLNGIFKPSSGRVLIDGEDVHQSKQTLRRVRQRIGMSFQFPERQLFGRTVWEEFTYTLQQHRIASDDINARIETAASLLQFDLQHFRDRSPFALSRSEQRKLGLAVILSLRPELIALDEPTAGLDRANAVHLLELLSQLHQANHSDVLIVSHDLELLLKYAGWLLVLHQGRIAFSGTPQDLLAQPDILAQIGLPLPPVYQLLQRLHAQPSGLFGERHG
ncbi:ABC transporter related [Candidatus Moduliflexus flocculans]|uniref:ABC transporter related n=1 Tax=Candidatus Moduliflexus flocculans TaxID=1499966 RepID=A0A081BQJ4_9BACT|nr:ABC transporter related [Candidatus Moduliflexus flocculans]